MEDHLLCVPALPVSKKSVSVDLNEAQACSGGRERSRKAWKYAQKVRELVFEDYCSCDVMLRLLQSGSRA